MSAERDVWMVDSGSYDLWGPEAYFTTEELALDYIARARFRSYSLYDVNKRPHRVTVHNSPLDPNDEPQAAIEWRFFIDTNSVKEEGRVGTTREALLRAPDVAWGPMYGERVEIEDADGNIGIGEVSDMDHSPWTWVEIEVLVHPCAGLGGGLT